MGGGAWRGKSDAGDGEGLRQTHVRITVPPAAAAAPGEAYEFNAAACAKRALKNKALVGGVGVGVGVGVGGCGWVGVRKRVGGALEGVEILDRSLRPRERCVRSRAAPRDASDPCCAALQGYLACLGDAAVTEQLLRRFREATNMTDEISALAALDRAGACLRLRCAWACAFCAVCHRPVLHPLFFS